MTKYKKQTEQGTIYYDGNSIVIGDIRIFNPTHQQLIADGWEEYEYSQPTKNRLLWEAKQNKINEIEAYDSSQSVNVFTIEDTQTWLSPEVRNQLRLSVQAYQESCLKKQFQQKADLLPLFLK